VRFKVQNSGKALRQRKALRIKGGFYWGNQLNSIEPASKENEVRVLTIKPGDSTINQSTRVWESSMSFSLDLFRGELN
jgi:hypothetical protein